MERDAEAAGEERGHDADHADGDDDAEGGANGSGADVVGHTLRHEHLHQVLALGADGADHPHLHFPFRGEHDEDEEDEECAGGDGEEPAAANPAAAHAENPAIDTPRFTMPV